MALGMTQAEADAFIFRGTDQGSQLAGALPLWTDGGLIQDPAFGTSGFSALPGSIRNSDGTFQNQPGISNAFFWTSTPSNAFGILLRALDNSTPQVFRAGFEKTNGVSVRCIQD